MTSSEGQDHPVWFLLRYSAVAFSGCDRHLCLKLVLVYHIDSASLALQTLIFTLQLDVEQRSS